MRGYRDRALVVRRYQLGEADRILVLLTQDHGLVRAVAKGVRRTRSRFGSRLDPFTDIDVQLYPGRSLATITQADTVETWAAAIVDDYPKYTAACAVLESAERFAAEVHGPQHELWQLTRAALAEIARTIRMPALVLDSYLLKAMGLAGWQPSLVDCSQCGAPGPHTAFHAPSGGAVCVQCRPPGAATPPPEAVRLMWWLANDAWPAVDAAATEPGFMDIVARARTLVQGLVQWHLERGVRALNFVEVQMPGTMNT
ncbi:DNA repair protein RecO [Corynebacterium ulceribovis]|uniref:DNA repair protein RecO n=1 Tax=Corynebacterium ulceribovis TaxID=487732 RepID=UPI00047795C0|nr:DNA repair protein RecO [Corynebacterium ulceribovis]